MTSLFIYDGNEAKELSVDVESSSVADLYRSVAKLYGNLKNPRQYLRLYFTDKGLTFSRKKISCYGVTNRSTIGVVLCLPNGCETDPEIDPNNNTPSLETRGTDEVTKESFEELINGESNAKEDAVVAETEDMGKKDDVLKCEDLESIEVEESEKKKIRKKKNKNKKGNRKQQIELKGLGVDKNSAEKNGDVEITDERKHICKEERSGDDNQNQMNKSQKKKKQKKVLRKEKTEELVERPLLQRIQGIIEITDEPDCNEDSPSARMECGHLISSQTMRMQCKTEVVDKGNFRIPCTDCSIKWDYRFVRHVGCFTVEEMHSLEKDILHNFLGKDKSVFPCPGCSSWASCIHEDSACLKCFSCYERTGKKFLFCRHCFQEWKGPLDKLCANLDCRSYAELTLNILRNSPLIFPFCPLFIAWSIFQHRVCPRCGLLTEFSGGCTQVHCGLCGHHYCFVCLNGADSKEELKCIPYFSECVLAPVQTKLPVWKQ